MDITSSELACVISRTLYCVPILLSYASSTSQDYWVVCKLFRWTQNTILLDSRISSIVTLTKPYAHFIPSSKQPQLSFVPYGADALGNGELDAADCSGMAALPLEWLCVRCCDSLLFKSDTGFTTVSVGGKFGRPAG